MTACGLDFGTSNSGLARPAHGAIELVPVEDGATSIPTAVFFDVESAHPALYGRAAVREYLDGTPGRLMRSLKSLLGSSLVDETTAIGDRQVKFTDVITLFLRMLRERGGAAIGAPLTDVVLGRPVRFVDDDAERDRAAQATLAGCAKAAGFRHVEFQLEPIAAAFDYERTIAREELVLVVDVGGGTADFTVIRLAPERRAAPDRTRDVLANGGVHVAGTDFDERLNLAWVMPALGHRTIGPKGLEVPSLVYFDLSTWHRINFLYTPKFLGELRDLQAFFGDLRLYGRLVHVIEERYGHELLGRTEQAKIALSTAATATLDLAHIERGLAVEATRTSLEVLLVNLLARLAGVGLRTVRAAGLTPERIATVYFTGGSSGMTALRDAFAQSFPASRLVVGDLFGSVVSGLGIDAGRRFGPRAKRPPRGA
jgi:hypothetical chaperone protein